MKLEIVLCTYNPNLKFLREQVISLQEQTQKQWLCIVCDDASANFQEIKDLIGSDQRFVVLGHASNLGSYKNFERALGYLSEDCEFVAFCDQDDIWYPDKLAVSLSTLENSNTQLIHCDMRAIGEEGHCIYDSVWQMECRQLFSHSPSRLLFRNAVTGCSMMVRRSLIERAKPFPSVLGLHHDHWLALVANSEILAIPRVLMDYRQHGGNVVGVQKQKALSEHSLQNFFKNAKATFQLRKTLLATLKNKQIAGSYKISWFNLWTQVRFLNVTDLKTALLIVIGYFVDTLESSHHRQFKS